MTEPKEESVFEINQSMFQKLTEWQEKMEELNAAVAEDTEPSGAPKPEEVKKAPPPTDLPG